MNLHNTAIRNRFFSALPNNLYFHIITVHEMPLEPFLPIFEFFSHVHSTLLTLSWCTIYNSRDHIISTLYFKDNKIMHLEWEIVERGGYIDLFQIPVAIAMKNVAGANSIPYAPWYPEPSPSCAPFLQLATKELQPCTKQLKLNQEA
jgi:hypothetical protein